MLEKNLSENIHTTFEKALNFQNNQDYPKAINAFQSCLSLLNFKYSYHRRTAGELRVRIGILYQATGNFDLAFCYALRGLRGLEQNQGKASLRVHAMTTLATYYWYKSDLRASLGWFEQAVHTIKGNPHIPAIQRVEALDNLGLCLFALEQTKEAVILQQRALKLAQKHQMKDTTHRIFRRLANSYQDNGDFTLARALLEKCQPATDAQSQDQIGWFNSSAILAERSGALALAEKYWDNALQLLPQSGHKRWEQAALLSNAALLKLDLGKVVEAKELAAQLWRVKGKSAPLSARLGSLRIRASLAENRGDFTRAISHWQRSLDILTQGTDDNQNQRAQIISQICILLEKSEQNSAAKLLLGTEIDNARLGPEKILPPYMAGLAIEYAGHLLAQEDTKDAGLLLMEVTALPSNCTDIHLQLKLLATLADFAASKNCTQAAILLGKLSVRTLVDTICDPGLNLKDQRAFIKNRQKPVHQLTLRLAKAGRIPEALEISSFAKMEGFALSVNRNRKIQAQLPTISMRDEEQVLMQNWSAHCIRGAQLLAQTNDWRLQRNARKKADVDLQAWGNSSEAIVKELLSYHVKRQTKANEIEMNTSISSPKHLVVRFGVVGDKIIVQALGENYNTSHELSISAGEVGHKILEYHQAIFAQSNDHHVIGDWIFQALFSRFQKKLSNVSELTISVDGMLAYLPFSCLVQNGKFLVEKLQLSTHLVQLRPPHVAQQISDKRQSIVAFGTDYAQSTHPTLPALNSEMDAIGSVTSDATLVRDVAFTRNRLSEELAKRPKYIHIACHYELVPGAANRSFLLLGDGTRLYLPELAQGDFSFKDVECVTLSACNSATQEDSASGMQSLASVILALGAKSVIGALWPIDDFQTSAFMATLYKNMLSSNSNSSPLQALRKTQIASINYPENDTQQGMGGGAEKRHEALSSAPCHWAGFSHFTAKH